MNKRELIREVMEEHNLPRREAKMVLEMVFGTIRDLLLKGEEVRVDGVGVFKFKYRNGRTVQNNFVGTRHKIGPSVKVRFKSFRSFQKELNDALMPGED